VPARARKRLSRRRLAEIVPDVLIRTAARISFMAIGIDALRWESVRHPFSE
jgi:hypothetical protein